MKNNREQSLIIIKEANMEFMAAIFKFGSKWAKERGMQGFVRNTPQGYYELFAVEKDAEDEIK